ncbi:MAG TPA: preprotein translocase subunit YajC, partial [Dehalococcoidia bacterium]|nr:preprotein translocase subunit YajC [Dehalococcoidia bacterium]
MAEVLLITFLVVGLFYFLFIRPTRREEGRRKRDLNALRIGDEVLTRGGLIATVMTVDTPEDGPMVLGLRLADGVVVRARTEAIQELLVPVKAEEEDDEGWDEEGRALDASPSSDGEPDLEEVGGG